MVVLLHYFMAVLKNVLLTYASLNTTSNKGVIYRASCRVPIELRITWYVNLNCP